MERGGDPFEKLGFVGITVAILREKDAVGTDLHKGVAHKTSR